MCKFTTNLIFICAQLLTFDAATFLFNTALGFYSSVCVKATETLKEREALWGQTSSQKPELEGHEG